MDKSVDLVKEVHSVYWNYTNISEIHEIYRKNVFNEKFLRANKEQK